MSGSGFIFHVVVNFCFGIICNELILVCNPLILMIFGFWMFFVAFVCSIVFFMLYCLCAYHIISLLFFFYITKGGEICMLIYEDQERKKFIFNDKGGVYELLLTKGRNFFFF